jgi:hypothetical protein
MTKARPMQYEFSVQMRTSDLSDELKDAVITWATPKDYTPSINDDPTVLTRASYIVTSSPFGAYSYPLNVLQAGKLYRYNDQLLNNFPAKLRMLEKSAITQSPDYLVPYVNIKIASMLSKLAISGSADPLWGRIEATRLNLR